MLSLSCRPVMSLLLHNSNKLYMRIPKFTCRYGRRQTACRRVLFRAPSHNICCCLPSSAVLRESLEFLTCALNGVVVTDDKNMLEAEHGNWVAKEVASLPDCDVWLGEWVVWEGSQNHPQFQKGRLTLAVESSLV